jgi:hypothetical protein
MEIPVVQFLNVESVLYHIILDSEEEAEEEEEE